MLITVAYLYLWLRFHRGYAALLRDTLRRLQRAPDPRLSFSFCRCPRAPPALSRGEPGGNPCEEPGEEPGVFLQLGDKAVYVTEPQVCSDLSRWAVLQSSSSPHSCSSAPQAAPQAASHTEHISFIIEASSHRAWAPAKRNHKVLGWSELCVPLAHCPLTPGQPYRALARASVEDFSSLGVAFIEDRLLLEDHLWPSKIVPVRLEESHVTALLTCPSQHSVSPCPTLPHGEVCHLSVDQSPLLCRKGSLHLPPEHPRHLDQRRGSDPLCPDPALQRDPGSQRHMEEHGHGPLHLSSCHECLELENSTILSVKYASAENIPDLPEDGAVLSGGGGDDALDDGLPNPGADVSSKPPNVLVYTGGCEQRYRTVRHALAKCINMDDYMIYQLSPAQALSDPWMDNCRLLVVAEEPGEDLSAYLQTRFLTYLSGGGRLLGLVSRLCPAGVSLRSQEDMGEDAGDTLSFTREDSSTVQLSVRASGHVYMRDVRGGGEVELWGELSGGHMVIVRVTHGDDGGEAVLCQVHLERAADLHCYTSEDPERPVEREELHGEELRLEVLEEILSSLGLNCEPSVAPGPSPVHLLATSTEAHSVFVKWLKSQVDDTGLLRLPKVSLRLVPGSEAQSGSDPGSGPVSLVWDSSEGPSPQHFSLQVYKSHLRSRVLGHTLLYADVVSSTMDLLEGLNLRVPGDTGLVAVAARQSHGRGRSRNGWLSPLGCAMFTMCLQVELSSRLGQRIPFLQHLVALAVVEAVRTLPGYEDLDLRVKWPNDIYHSSGVKLGGVLVTSTVLGSTFHLLIGCGFNVSNSSPTVCINDLIQRHNQEHGLSLQPLSPAHLIARSLSLLEELIKLFQREGPDAVLPKYYSRWMHSGSRVRVWSEEGPEVDVVGLDQNGFLQVHCPERGLMSLEPDGNSFDMLKNLLVMKHH